MTPTAKHSNKASPAACQRPPPRKEGAAACFMPGALRRRVSGKELYKAEAHTSCCRLDRRRRLTLVLLQNRSLLGLFRFPRDGASAGLDSLGIYTARGRRFAAMETAATDRKACRKAFAELRPLVTAPTTTLASTSSGTLLPCLAAWRATHLSASK